MRSSTNTIRSLDKWLSVKEKFEHFYKNETVEKDGHILWNKTKPYRMGGLKTNLTVMISREIVDVRRASCWLRNGFSDFKSTWTSCGIDNCVNPDHIILTNNIRLSVRKHVCKRGHDLNDENNIMITKRTLGNGEPYFSTKCRICSNIAKVGKEPKGNHVRLTLDNFHLGVEKDKCKRGHLYDKTVIENGRERKVCKKCKALSMRERRAKKKEQQTHETI